MIIDALEPLTDMSKCSRNRKFSFIANLRYGLPYTTEVLIRGVVAGFRGIGEI